VPIPNVIERLAESPGTHATSIGSPHARPSFDAPDEDAQALADPFDPASRSLRTELAELRREVRRLRSTLRAAGKILAPYVDERLRG
jgi:hypothetical protein